MKRLCGAHLWCDWTLAGPLKDRLYEYVGTGNLKGEIIYQFIPYKRMGYPVIFTHDEISRRLNYFRPFLIDNGEFITGGYVA